MGGVVSAGENNDDLIDHLKSANYIRTPEVEHVLRKVDRADFFPGRYLEDSWKDMAWKEGFVHLSAPCIYCSVLENLELGRGQSFLNVGSGTGYLSTMVGMFLGANSDNHGIDLYQECVDYAEERVLDFMRFNEHLDTNSFCRPIFKRGNGLYLSSTYRQYDRVYVGAAAAKCHQSFFKSLVNVGGILIMPVDDSLQKFKRIRAGDCEVEENWESCSLLNVQFAPLIEDDPTQHCDVLIEFASEPKSLLESSRLATLANLRERSDVFSLNIPRSLARFLAFGRELGQARPPRQWQQKPMTDVSSEVIFFGRRVLREHLFRDLGDDSDQEMQDENIEESDDQRRLFEEMNEEGESEDQAVSSNLEESENDNLLVVDRDGGNNLLDENIVTAPNKHFIICEEVSDDTENCELYASVETSSRTLSDISNDECHTDSGIAEDYTDNNASEDDSVVSTRYTDMEEHEGQ